MRSSLCQGVCNYDDTPTDPTKTKWNPDDWPWHVGRPMLGIGFGCISVLILKAGILAVGTVPVSTTAPSPTKLTTVPSNLLYIRDRIRRRLP